MLGLTRLLRVRIDAPAFTRSRYQRRYNMQDEDRVKLFNWNVACIVLTALPFAYMQCVDYRSSEDTDLIMRTLDPMREAPVTYAPLFRL